jgi:hypothetical protein
MRIETLLIGTYQRRLPHRGCRLRQVHFVWTLGELQACEARHDGATGHQHNITTARAQGRQLIRQLLNDCGIQTCSVISEQRTAHFDDPAPGSRQSPSVMLFCG